MRCTVWVVLWCRPLATNHLGLGCPGGRSSPPCSLHWEEIWSMTKALQQLL
jgi:hypothetical protein